MSDQIESNKWGKNFQIELYGASHSPEIGVKIHGFPKFDLVLDKIRVDMDRRKPGFNGVLATTRRENDEFEIHSGIVDNKTNGEVIWISIPNTNTKPNDYSTILRPGHADWTSLIRYNQVLTGGGQFSARLTAPVVFAGSLAKQYLEKYNIVFNAFIDSVGGTKVSNQTEIEAAISTAKEKSDSVGATITIIIKNVPAGIGSDFFGGIEAKLSNLFFSIPACKGVEFGEGFELSKKNGSDTNDGIYIDENKKLYTKTNHMGGILGGISNGMDITARLAFKPTASIGLEQDSVDYKTFEQTKIIVGGRHDPCVALRAPVIVECYAALGILDLIMDFEKNK